MGAHKRILRNQVVITDVELNASRPKYVGKITERISFLESARFEELLRIGLTI